MPRPALEPAKQRDTILLKTKSRVSRKLLQRVSSNPKRRKELHTVRSDGCGEPWEGECSDMNAGIVTFFRIRHLYLVRMRCG